MFFPSRKTQFLANPRQPTSAECRVVDARQGVDNTYESGIILYSRANFALVSVMSNRQQT